MAADCALFATRKTEKRRRIKQSEDSLDAAQESFLFARVCVEGMRGRQGTRGERRTVIFIEKSQKK
ncbi:hypothetical protein [Brevibacillus marinus]|uniref:hypothetical protein n=1 Tax=Brevibacillus marinus TaxID=2496837 RepID=UPI000F81EDCA|nr:hypothetical protein [Brevibacillus marinus]